MKIDLTQIVTPEMQIEAVLTEARLAAKVQLMALVDTVTAVITGDVPLAEKLSWGSKEDAARAIVAGKADPRQSALIAGEAEVTGEDEPSLAARIISNADAYRAVIARLTGLRRRAEVAIARATDTSSVEIAMAELSAGVAAVAQTKR